MKIVRAAKRDHDFYHVDGFRIAAEIERGRRRVEGTSNTPRKPAWVRTVVENALKHERRAKPAPGQQPFVPQSPMPVDSEPISEWNDKVAILAHKKSMK
jgi:hypothetical protein